MKCNPIGRRLTPPGVSLQALAIACRACTFYPITSVVVLGRTLMLTCSSSQNWSASQRSVMTRLARSCSWPWPRRCRTRSISSAVPTSTAVSTAQVYGLVSSMILPGVDPATASVIRLCLMEQMQRASRPLDAAAIGYRPGTQDSSNGALSISDAISILIKLGKGITQQEHNMSAAVEDGHSYSNAVLSAATPSTTRSHSNSRCN